MESSQTLHSDIESKIHYFPNRITLGILVSSYHSHRIIGIKQGHVCKVPGKQSAPLLTEVPSEIGGR